MVDGWKPVVIAEELFEVCRKDYEKKKDQLKLQEGVRSLTGYIGFLVREQLKLRKVI